MVTVFAAPLKKRRPVGLLTASIIKKPRRSVALDAVPLEIAQMRSCPANAPPIKPDQPRLDDDAALAKPGKTVPPAKQPGESRAAPDAATVKPRARLARL